jgi:LuxR family transcriptional regulator, maltose regulon positive regulatory protein
MAPVVSSEGGRGIRRDDTAASRTVVSRPRLLRQLLDNRSKPLVLLCAPAGYGKTTLLEQWAADDERLFAWATLGPEHNDPGLLLAAVARALKSIGVLAVDAATTLSLPATPRHGDALAGVAQSVADPSCPHVLVLDDSHVLHARGAMRALRFLVESVAPGSALAIASRAEPALPLGRMRANRWMVEVRQKDLVMTRGEGASLLARLGLDLDANELDALVRRTEGWPAALYLAGLALDDQSDVRTGIARFAGDDRFVVDYLQEEFLEHLSAERREFLLRSSILDRLSGAVCDDVLERSESGELLRDLARSNMLVVPVDRNDETYRLHGLLAEMLQSELHRREPDVESKLHARASLWYEAQGDRDRAVHHALAARDFARLGRLVWAALPEYVANGRNATVQLWLDRIPYKRVASSLPLALAAGYVSFTAGQGGLAEHWAAVAEARLEDESADGPAGAPANSVAILRAALGRTEIATIGAQAARAGELEPADSPWQPWCYLLDGVARHLSGDFAGARPLLERGASRAVVAAPNVQALCQAQLALGASEGGDWGHANQLIGHARARCDLYGFETYPTMALVYAVSAFVRSRSGEIEIAKRDLRRGASLLDALGDLAPWYEAEARIALARAAIRLDDVAGARALLVAAGRFVQRIANPGLLASWLEESWATALGHSATARSGRWRLTAAELRLLQLLPSHLSFREIADHLYVSVNTVKTQARSIYRKLDASTRARAVERGLEAGLLDPPAGKGEQPIGSASPRATAVAS